MPADEYAAAFRGALRLKGAKVAKPKPKKNKLNVLNDGKMASVFIVSNAATKDKDKDKDVDDAAAAEDESAGICGNSEGREGNDEPAIFKTEAQRLFEERKQRRLANLPQESAGSSLLKTHKERVEELNTYLSKLSEHHDMPKIGPG